MSTSEHALPPGVDPAEVDELIDEFSELEASNPRLFNQALARNILTPDPAETAAFRSAQLTMKAIASATQLMNEAGSSLRSKRRGSPEAKSAEHFIQAVGRERTIMSNIHNGRLAARGQLPNEPNPRRRAERRLVALNLKGDVPQGMFRTLLNEEIEADKEQKRSQKQRRKEARRASS